MRLRSAALAWEIGGGRGHIVRLGAAAEALNRIGVACQSAVLIHTEYAHEIAGKVGRIRNAPLPRALWTHRDERKLPLASTYGEWLGDCGLFAADNILQQLEAWRRIFDEDKPDLVVCNQAPYAILAAKSLGIATAVIGNWYSAPPIHLHAYPPLPYREHVPYWNEAQMVDAINAAMAAFGGPYLKYLPQVYDCDALLCSSLDILDVYDGQRIVARIPPITQPIHESGGGPHDEVFVYYSLDERFDPVMLTAIMSLPVPVRAFIPGCDPGIAEALRSRGVMMETAPVPAGDLVRRTRVFAHAAPHGLVSLCLRAGIPFVAAPRLYEPNVNARRCADEGVAVAVLPAERTVPKIRNAILELYESTAYHQRARALAERLAPQFSREPADVIAERIGAAFP